MNEWVIGDIHNYVIGALGLVSRGQAGKASKELSAAALRFLNGQPPDDERSIGASILETAELMGLKINLELNEGYVPPRLRASLVESAREAVVNVARHSGAKDVHVEGQVNSAAACIRVADRGVGFDTESGRRGHGLTTSISGRMLEVGGVATIQSREGFGTTVELRWPAENFDKSVIPHASADPWLQEFLLEKVGPLLMRLAGGDTLTPEELRLAGIYERNVRDVIACPEIMAGEFWEAVHAARMRGIHVELLVSAADQTAREFCEAARAVTQVAFDVRRLRVVWNPVAPGGTITLDDVTAHTMELMASRIHLSTRWEVEQSLEEGAGLFTLRIRKRSLFNRVRALAQMARSRPLPSFRGRAGTTNAFSALHLEGYCDAPQ